MVAHPGIRKIPLTGSVATGRSVTGGAAKTLKRLTLEFGENDAAILLDNIDPDNVAPRAFLSAFSNCEQICVAIKLLHARERHYAAIVSRLEKISDTAVVRCVVQTGMRAVQNVARVATGNSVLVVGAGPIGVSVVQGAKLAKAATIIAVDPNGERRSLGLSLDTTQAFACDPPELVDEIWKVTAGRSGTRLRSRLRPTGSRSVRRRHARAVGSVVMIGVPGLSVKATLQPMTFDRTEAADRPHARQLQRADRIAAIHRSVVAGPARHSSAHYGRQPLVEINAAFEDLAAGCGLRTVLAI